MTGKLKPCPCGIEYYICPICDARMMFGNRRSGEAITGSTAHVLSEAADKIKHWYTAYHALLADVEQMRNEMEYATKQEELHNQRPQLVGAYAGFVITLTRVLDKHKGVDNVGPDSKP